MKGWFLSLSFFAFILHPSSFILAATAAPTPPPDIRSIVPPQPFSLAADWWWLVVAGGCLVLAGLVLWLILRRPKMVVVGPVPTTRQVAARRLQELEAQMHELDARSFGGAVADVLRVYIGAQYGLKPERQTSEEFLASITGSRAFSMSEHALLRDFLGGCDLLKFARADATLDGKRALLIQAREFLEGSAQAPPLAAAPPRLTPAA